MSLVAESEARKARLLALRKRKAGEVDASDACVAFVSEGRSCADSMPFSSADLPLKHRNFDPESRTLRKYEGPGEDTVENAVEGLQERIIAEDASRREQELVRFT